MNFYQADYKGEDGRSPERKPKNDDRSFNQQRAAAALDDQRYQPAYTQTINDLFSKTNNTNKRSPRGDTNLLMDSLGLNVAS